MRSVVEVREKIGERTTGICDRRNRGKVEFQLETLQLCAMPALAGVGPPNQRGQDFTGALAARPGGSHAPGMSG